MSRFGDEFAPQSSGAWTAGWYQGGILREFTGGKGTVVKTEDRPSQGGDSRNISLAVVIQNGSETRNKIVNINYRPDDITDERIGAVRDRIKQCGGKLPSGDPDMRSFLTMRRLRELEVLAGVELHANGNGFDLEPVIGKMADFYVAPGKPNLEGKVYDEVKQIAPVGSKVKN